MSSFFLWSPVDGASSYTMGFDIVVDEAPTFGTQVTEHPVEKGANVTDHVRVAVNKLTLEVFVSNEPVEVANTWGVGVSAPGGPLTTPAASGQPVPIPGQPILTAKEWFTPPVAVPLATSLLASEVDTPFAPNVGLQPTVGQVLSPKVLQFPVEFDAVQLTHDALDLLRRSVQLLTVYGTKGVYDNMIIEEFSMARNANTGTGASFTITLREIRQVETSIVPSPKPSIPRGNKQKGKGGQAATDKPTPPAGGEQSILSMIVGWLGGGP